MLAPPILHTPMGVFEAHSNCLCWIELPPTNIHSSGGIRETNLQPNALFNMDN